MSDLQSLKEGDQVLIYIGVGAEPGIRKIDRLTPTQVVIGNDKFNRKTGEKIGSQDRWSRTRIAAPKEGQIEQITNVWKRRLLAHKVGTIKWDTLPAETLQAVLDLVAAQAPSATGTKPTQ